MPPDENQVEAVSAAALAGASYRTIFPGLAQRIAAQELAKGRSFKEAVKATRSKLHQIGGAYLEKPPDYNKYLDELHQLPSQPDHPMLMDFCRRLLGQHASTRERLPILEEIFTQSLAGISPLHSVIDLACGFNPLALPWFPIAANGVYYACDIYTDMIAFINAFLEHTGQPGKADLCDLGAGLPPQRVQLALLLKSLPCLEQSEKNISKRLLEAIPADYLLVSFPAQSLGGRSKGMTENYAARFEALLGDYPWQTQRFNFSSELVYLIKK